jgi:membrane protease YdiL (CAAX protease family)
VLPNDSSSAAVGRRKSLRFPILLVAMLVVMAGLGAVNAAMSGLGLLEFVVGMASAAAALFCYHRLSKAVEQRRTVAELPRSQMRSALLRGIAIGTGIFLATMVLMLIFGGWERVEGGSFWAFLATTGAMACIATTEELVFRGVVFRIVEERAGTWRALALSAVIFGAVHLASAYHDADAGAMLWGALAIAVEAGIMLGAAYVVSRNLWLPIGIHFAWNLSEAGVFGTTVSGSANDFGGLLRTTLSGPSALTGGAFGPEASLLAILTCSVPAVLLLRRAARTGRIRSRPHPAGRSRRT